MVAEPTPNPDSIMFYPKNRDVMGDGARTKQHKDKHECVEAPLASALFRVTGVDGVLLGAKHVTVTKKDTMAWDLLKPNIELVMSQFFAAGLDPVDPKMKWNHIVV